MTLTKIYCMTHGYQTLVREITTPTLPTFITSCLNLISTKSSLKHSSVSSSLEKIVLQSFAILVPRHTTIYRPFVSQIRLILRLYLAPTSFDGAFVSSSLKNDARHLSVILHQTAPKNTGGEEWAKSVRELVRDIHATADLVFRAVIEDWESSAAYHAEPVDVNRELQGGGKTEQDLPPWTGVYAGAERLSGLLEYLADYFKSDTSTPVAIPLASIFDLITRMLSIPIPSSDASSAMGSVRLHPAVDRDEKDGLWAGLPQIYVAALHLLDTIADRLQENFIPLAQGSFDQLTWVFPHGKHSSEFRQVAYAVSAKILRLVGPSFDRSQGPKVSPVIKSCCQDLASQEKYLMPLSNNITGPEGKKSQHSHNADTFLRSIGDGPMEMNSQDPNLVTAAGELLPLFMSHFPQQHLDISVRSLVERTAILSHNKHAMIASILNPFVGKNGRTLATILPHLAREFPDDDVTEILLRPRMPLLPSKSTLLLAPDVIVEESEDDDMELNAVPISSHQESGDTPDEISAVASHPSLGPAQENFGSDFNASLKVPSISSTYLSTPTQALPSLQHQDITMNEGDEDSDNESVHLTMQLDTDSEDE